MAPGYCPSCGTEVDADARFCPTCGSALSGDAEQADLPPAPGWPEREEQEPPGAGHEQPEGDQDAAIEGAGDAEHTADEAPPAVEEGDEPGTQPEPAPGAAAPGPPPLTPAAAASQGGSPASEAGVDLHLTWPTMLSGWLIGIGSLVGALSLLASLGDGVSVVLFLALLGVAATVFVADRLPAIPRLQLIVLSISMVGLGIGFERAGFGARGADSVLLVAMIAAAGGALLVELDRDRPVPPPAR